jgi:hypothetical protein
VIAMRQGTYLNVILTVNAALLTGVLWTQVAERPALSSAALAQSAPRADGIPNAAAQRQKMIEALRDLKASMDANTRLLESGKLKVEVTNLSDIKIDSGK